MAVTSNDAGASQRADGADIKTASSEAKTPLIIFPFILVISIFVVHSFSRIPES